MRFAFENIIINTREKRRNRLFNVKLELIRNLQVLCKKKN